MSTLSNLYLTAADWAKRLDPQGNTADIVELLSQKNEILEDMTFVECNNLTSHEITQRTQLPTVYYSLLNQGVLPSKSSTAQVVEGTSMLKTFSQIDCDIVDKNRNPKKFRLTEAQPHVEAMSQRQATTLIYGNVGTAPEEFTGFMPRMSSLTAGNASNVIDGGGVGSDNTSILAVCWGDNTVTGIFPTGSKAGISHENKGKVLIQNAGGVTGAMLDMYVDYWRWDCGLAVPDWRAMARVCNIDVSNLTSETSAADITKLLIKATWRIRRSTGKKIIYMNSTVAQMFDIQRVAAIAAGGGLTFENVDGKVRMSFRSIPIKIVDAILETEARVV